MVHTVEIQVSPIERRKERICEIDVPIAPDHDVVRRIETLSFKLVGENFDPALAIGPGHAPGFVFARVQAPLPVHRISVCAVGILAIHFRFLSGNILVEPVSAVIAEDQKTLARPDRSLATGKTAGHLLHLQL